MTEDQFLRLKKISNRAHIMWDAIENAREARKHITERLKAEGPVILSLYGSDLGIELRPEDYRDALLPIVDAAVARLEREFAQLEL